MATRLIPLSWMPCKTVTYLILARCTQRVRTSGFGAMFTNEDAVEHGEIHVFAPKCSTGALLPKYGRVSWVLGTAPGNFTALDPLVNV